MKKYSFALIAFLAILSGCTSNEVTTTPNQSEVCDTGSSCSVSTNYKYGYNVGNVIEDITLTDLDGNESSLYDLMEGYEKIIISLEASWCSDCHRQDEKLINTYDSLDEDVLIIPVFTSYSKEGDAERTANYDTTVEYVNESGLAELGIGIYYDYDDTLFDAFGRAGTPTNVVLDTNGRIKAISLEYDFDILLQDN